MENINLVGIDISKRNFHVVGVNHAGKEVFKARWYREEVEEKIATKLPRGCTIAMEACGSSHYWGRMFESQGAQVRLLPAQHVTAFRTGQKNDYNDAFAICEASQRPNVHKVAVKTVTQQDLQCLHRVREQLVRERVAVSNQLHGLLLEYGFAVPKGKKAFTEVLQRILDSDDVRLSALMRRLVRERFDTFFEIQKKIDGYEKEIKLASKQHPGIKKLQTVPGIGIFAASAIFAAIGDNPKAFKNGRNFAASLGLVPRQNSTGGVPKLGGITKTGDVYIRKLLVHGARSVVRHASRKTDPLSLWINSLRQRKATNVVATALANKIARVAWAILAHNNTYESQRSRVNSIQ